MEVASITGMWESSEILCTYEAGLDLSEVTPLMSHSGSFRLSGGNE